MSEYDKQRQIEKMHEAKGAQGQFTGHYANTKPYEDYQKRQREVDARSEEIALSQHRLGYPGPGPLPPEQLPAQAYSVAKPGIFAWLESRWSPEERDRSFANMLGFAVAGLFFWYAYARGFGKEWYRNLLIPAGAGLVCAGFFGWATSVTRALRKLSVILIWLAVAWIAYRLAVAMGFVKPFI